MPTLTLYHFNGCPYCAKVRNYMAAKGITVPLKDIHENPKFKEELMSIGGMAQVPCLVIDGEALYESDDIIEWMKGNLIKSKK